MKSIGEDIIQLVSLDRFEEAKAKLTELQDDAIDDEGNTLYHEAIKQQSIKLLRWLLSNYQLTVHADRPNVNGTTCFHIACAAGRTACFHELWNKSHIQPSVWGKSSDNDGQTPLHIACLGGHQSVAGEIVEKLKDEVLYNVNSKGQTALHMAAVGGHKSCVILLAQYKKLINTADMFGATALHYATNGGHLAVVQHLIERCNADKTKQTGNGMNLVHAAAASGTLSVVKYILGKTKNTMHKMTTSTGATTLHIATGLGFEEILHYLLTKPNLYSLINHSDMNGWTAAHLAALRNQATCLAVLVGFNAEVYSMKDKNGKSVCEIMSNNETAELRQTFPYLYGQLDAEKEISRTNSQSLQEKEKKENGVSSKQSSLYERLATGEDEQKYQKRGGSSKRTLPLSAFDIGRSEMDFTKINPLMHSVPTNLKQRRFQKNNMAFPKNGYTDRMPVMAYQLGTEDDSDSDFQIENIEDIPETPMKTIQRFNNFSHSTYTPPPSMVDLTKIDSKVEALHSNSQSEKISLPATQSSAGDPLPIILDYTNAIDTEEAITIYFHNGRLNTVKVKTLIKNDGIPQELRPEGNQHNNIVQGKVTTAIIQVDPELKSDNSTDERPSNLSGEFKRVDPPTYTAKPSKFDRLINSQPTISTTTTSQPAPHLPTGTPPSNTQTEENNLAVDARMGERERSFISSPHSSTSPSPANQPNVVSELTAKFSPINLAIADSSILNPSTLYLKPSVYKFPENVKQEDEILHVRASSTSSVESFSSLPPPPLPPPLDPKLVLSSDSSSKANTPHKLVAIFNDYEFPESDVSSVLNGLAEYDPVAPYGTDKDVPVISNGTAEEHVSQGASSPAPLSPTVQANFTFQTIDKGESSAESDEESQAPGVTKRQVEFGAEKEIPFSPDTLERDYLSFATNEINTVGEDHTKDMTTRGQSEDESSELPVIMRNKNKPNAGANRLLRRLSSNASDVSDTNVDLKSSTSYKFNYRAYKKKISTKHDTVTDLFEYDPIE